MDHGDDAPLLIPLIILVMLALWLVLLPFSLWQRYRFGKARRCAWPWSGAPERGAAAAVGVVYVADDHDQLLVARAEPRGGNRRRRRAGGVGLLLSRFERTPQGLFYTPNAWLILALTVIVAARIGMGFVELWRYWQGRESLACFHRRPRQPVLGGRTADRLLPGVHLGAAFAAARPPAANMRRLPCRA